MRRPALFSATLLRPFEERSALAPVAFVALLPITCAADIVTLPLQIPLFLVRPWIIL